MVGCMLLAERSVWWAPLISHRWKPVTPLVLQLYFWDHRESLNDTWSGITNSHPDFQTGSNFRIWLPIGHISITQPSYQLLHNESGAKRKNDVCIIFWSAMGSTSPFSMVTPYWQETLFPVAHQTSISLILKWFIPDEMMCRWYQSTRASQDTQSHIADKYFTNNEIYWSPGDCVDICESTLISTPLSGSG